MNVRRRIILLLFLACLAGWLGGTTGLGGWSGTAGSQNGPPLSVGKIRLELLVDSGARFGIPRVDKRNTNHRSWEPRRHWDDESKRRVIRCRDTEEGTVPASTNVVDTSQSPVLVGGGSELCFRSCELLERLGISSDVFRSLRGDVLERPPQ